jgi:hypothetical protein
MALVGFRAPALPLPSPDYSPQQQAELLRALRLYFNLLDSFTPQQAQSYKADQLLADLLRAVQSKELQFKVVRWRGLAMG